MIRSVDIIIPVYKPDESFARELDMLFAQSFPYEKLIIVRTLTGDEETESLTDTVLSGHADPARLREVKINKDEFDHGFARRLGVSLSEADAFLCMTDDALPYDRDLISHLLDALNRDERAAVSYARQQARDDAGPAERFSREFNYPSESRVKSIKDLDTLGIRTYFSSNVAALYRRTLYDELNGFPEFAVFNEDMIYAARAIKAGYMVCYAADAVVVHSHNQGPIQALRRNFDNGMSQAMHPEVFNKVKSESEGMRFVKEGIGCMASTGKFGSIPGFILTSGLKLIGFKLGKNFLKLPPAAVKKLSSDPVLAGRALREVRV